MIHYHGGPITPLDAGYAAWKTAHAFVSYAYPNQARFAAENAHTFAMDNGAFTAWLKGQPMDFAGYAEWVETWRWHPAFDWCLIPDIIAHLLQRHHKPDGGAMSNDDRDRAGKRSACGGKMTYKQLQKEQAEWSMRNFGPHPVEHPLLGMIEELGELAHAHLKGLQGIRHTPEKILAMKKDACADLMIFMADYFTCRNRDLHDKVDFAVSEPCTDSATIDNMLYFLAIRDWHKLIAALAAYAESEGFDLHEETFRVWEEVKQRNWRKDSADVE